MRHRTERANDVHAPRSYVHALRSTHMPVHVGSAVLVTGDTYSAKATLKSIGGGAWCAPLNGWVFPESKRAAVASALGVDATAGADASDAAAAEPPAPTPSVDANATLLLGKHKKALLVTGETLKVKEQLKSLRGKWNRGLNGWIFPFSAKDDVLKLLRQDATNKVEEDYDDDDDGSGSVQEPAPKKAKKPKVEVQHDDDDDDDE
tara:strand:+ start:1125 stop:1739 length:615 start_codon:yes stop_codon:yes gene_type:complete